MWNTLATTHKQRLEDLNVSSLCFWTLNNRLVKQKDLTKESFTSTFSSFSYAALGLSTWSKPVGRTDGTSIFGFDESHHKAEIPNMFDPLKQSFVNKVIPEHKANIKVRKSSSDPTPRLKITAIKYFAAHRKIRPITAQMRYWFCHGLFEISKYPIRCMLIKSLDSCKISHTADIKLETECTCT